MSAWSEYKKKIGESRPWHMLDSSVQKAGAEEASRRYDICLSCDKLIKLTKQCRECGCIMPAKVKLEKATCPLNKW
jgi:hypothetical protein